MGEVLRHIHHNIDDEIVWDTVKDELPRMKEAVLKAIEGFVTPSAHVVMGLALDEKTSDKPFRFD